MLFAACTTAAPKPLQRTAHAASNLGQQQLTTLQQLKDHQHAMSLSSSPSSSASSASPTSSGLPTPLHMSPQHQVAAAKGNAAAVAAAARANEEAKEAMRKLDAKLVAYLAGETKLQPKQSEPELELELNSSNVTNANSDPYISDEYTDSVNETVENLTREELQLFRRIKSVKLQLEALTLEPEGTKRMDLLLNDTRPIFTVECQLSHELIKHVPRYEMFHIMQFESEKFHTLTQCTRFGQEAQRNVNLTPLIDELDYLHGNKNNNTAATAAGSAVDMPNFGRIHFTVWWREPGTCLNEMLGMGVFELRELYDAALLEQCKRITIQRRGVPLANIYIKINLLLCASADSNNNSANINIGCETAAAMKQHPGDGDKQEKRTTTDASGGTDISANAMTASTSSTSTSTSSSAKASEGNTKDNNNVQVSTDNNFNAETLKIRLLTGIMYACEVRGMVMCLKHEYHLICDRFWRSEAASARSLGAHLFYYQEQFSIIRDAQFLNRVKRKHLRLQIWQRPKSADTTDNNGNKKPRLEPLGVVFLPLHKFFVAFSNELMANRLVTEKLPVISTDEWVTIRGRKGEKLGEIKCLLAMGSEEQINNLKIARAFRPLHSDMFNSIDINSAQDPLYPNLRMPSEDVLTAVNVENKPKSIRRTVELMEMLEETLQQNQAAAISLRTTTTNTTNTNSGSPPTAAENVVEQPMIRLQERNFQFQLYVASAGSLPHNPAAKGKGGRSAAKRMTSKRFPPGESPTTYVTFQADECLGGSGRYKSHEGIVFATNVVERNTHPLWRQHFLVTVGAEYLENPEQNFILKLWKKANVPPGNGGASTSTARLLPKPTDDAIIGFAALDLSVFLIGMHISGTFNVIDFNGRINGQLQLKAKPIDGWYENYLRNKQPQSQQEAPSTSASTSTQHSAAGAAGAAANNAQIASGASIDNVIEQFGKSLDLIHLNLGQAIKHKFNELEGISKRLRTRLGDVTGGPLPEQSNAAGLNDWRPLKEVIVAESTMDDELTEFERDINVTPLDEAVGAELASDIDNLDEFEDDINEGACGVDDDDDDDDGDDEVKVDETVDDNKSDKKEILISKTAPGAADATVE